MFPVASDLARSAFPPKNFTPVVGCQAARFVEAPSFSLTKKMPTGSKGQGLRYQKKVEEFFAEHVKDPWVDLPGMWIEYLAKEGKVCYAQPDILFVNPEQGKIIIGEIKLSRVPDAWWQLNRKYKPLIEKLFPRWRIGLLEITATVYNVVVPEDVTLVHRFEDSKIGKTSLMVVKK